MNCCLAANAYVLWCNQRWLVGCLPASPVFIVVKLPLNCYPAASSVNRWVISTQHTPCSHPCVATPTKAVAALDPDAALVIARGAGVAAPVKTAERKTAAPHGCRLHLSSPCKRKRSALTGHSARLPCAQRVAACTDCTPGRRSRLSEKWPKWGRKARFVTRVLKLRRWR